MEVIFTTDYHSPVGTMKIGSIGETICMCDWVISHRHIANVQRMCDILHARCVQGDSPVIQEAISQLNEYFAGRRIEFSLPLLFWGSDFQCKVRRELINISYGGVITYGDLAQKIGNRRAVRAVASAVASNPISIFVPCHRVIGCNNSLTGYAGGIDAKRKLLNLESHRID